MKKSIGILLVFFLLLGVTTSIFAYEEQQPRPELKRELVKLKYVRAMQVHQLLQGYQSEYGQLRTEDQLNIVTIRDIPEIVEKMLSVIKEIDVKPVDILFTVDLILGSFEQELHSSLVSKEMTDKALQADPVMKEMQRVMSFKSLYKIGSALLRIQDGFRSEQRIGGPDMEFELRLRPRHIKEEKGDTFQLDLDLRQGRFILGQRENVSLIGTSLSLRSGEKTIVGVSKLDGGDRALVLVISGKIIK